MIDRRQDSNLRRCDFHDRKRSRQDCEITTAVLPVGRKDFYLSAEQFVGSDRAELGTWWRNRQGHDSHAQVRFNLEQLPPRMIHTAIV